MAPPVTGNYLTNLKTWADDFHALYPNLTVEIIETSWGDHNDKLSTMAQAGEAPDIAEISSNALGTYVEMGVAIDIAQYMAADRLADYDENALNSVHRRQQDHDGRPGHRRCQDPEGRLDL